MVFARASAWLTGWSGTTTWQEKATLFGAQIPGMKIMDPADPGNLVQKRVDLIQIQPFGSCVHQDGDRLLKIEKQFFRIKAAIRNERTGSSQYQLV